jgi:DNA repair ATPase RecN
MLTRLVIKNIALIDEVQIDFNKGLNIITAKPARASLFCWIR